MPVSQYRDITDGHGTATFEHVSMRALAAAGLEVAETQHLVFDDQEAVVVTRFDRDPRPALRRRDGVDP